MNAPVIQIDALHKAFKGAQALSDLTVSIPAGSTGLLGPNGAGKTTLLRVLLGHLRPDRGTVRIGDLDPASVDQRLMIRRRVGYMPEGDCLLPAYNAVEWVALLGQLTGMSHRDALSRTHEALDYVGIEEARYRKMHEYSTGMKQRIKLAQALVHDPPILLLDEPTNGLDPKGRRQMLDLIGDLGTQQHKHILLCSHLLPDVERTCQQVVVLRAGRVQLQGNIAVLTASDERVLAIELGEPCAPFVTELERLGYACSVELDGRMRVKIPPAHSDSDVFFELAGRCGTFVRALTESRSTLEEVLFDGITSSVPK